MSDIKIFVSCHKDVQIPSNPLLFPIQVGTAIAKSRFDGMLYDNEGDNISEKNRSYCELTAQYWAWKNAEADYYGFFHYRRYFSFSEEEFETNPFGEAIFKTNDAETLEKICLDEEAMRITIEQYDVIAPTQGGFKEKDLTIYNQYKIADVHNIEDLDIVLSIISEQYPDMYQTAKEYLDHTTGYFCNMFIMKKEIFQEYSRWLFSILEQHEQMQDFSGYNKDMYRVSGYLAERLCGIYLTYLKESGKYRFHELQRVFFENVEKEEYLQPKFSSENIAVVLSANDFYVPYMSTLLNSIKVNATPTKNYDIIVLNRDISLKNQSILKNECESDNFSIRFFNISKFMEDYTKLYVRGHFRLETYFRILMQDVLPDYKKVLYLDSDMVVLHDVAELYETNVEGYLLAACKDADTAGLYNGFEPQKKKYMDTILKIEQPYNYFQAGVVLFNLEEFRKRYTVKEMMEYAMSYQWELLDQDVLNYLAQGHVKFVDMSWNVMMDWNNIRISRIISLAPYYLYDAYMEARSKPRIIHYAGPDKPWDIPYSDMAEHFWKYARGSAFYEILITRMIASEYHRQWLPAVYDTVYRGTLKSKLKRCKQWIKHLLMPAINCLFPLGTARREKMKRFYFNMRGWEC